MKPTSQKNKRSGRSNGRLVVDSYQAELPDVCTFMAFKLDGKHRKCVESHIVPHIATDDRTVHWQQRAKVRQELSVTNRETAALARFRGLTGLGEHGPLIGKETMSINQSLFGVSSLSVTCDGVMFDIDGSEADFNSAVTIQRSGRGYGVPQTAARLYVKHEPELKRLHRLIA